MPRVKFSVICLFRIPGRNEVIVVFVITNYKETSPASIQLTLDLKTRHTLDIFLYTIGKRMWFYSKSNESCRYSVIPLQDCDHKILLFAPPVTSEMTYEAPL